MKINIAIIVSIIILIAGSVYLYSVDRSFQVNSDTDVISYTIDITDKTFEYTEFNAKLKVISIDEQVELQLDPGIPDDSYFEGWQKINGIVPPIGCNEIMIYQRLVDNNVFQIQCR